MPTGQNWMNYIFINLAFMTYMISLVYMSSIEEIRKNWAVYRCNPMYMPLSDNVGRDFTHCVQNIQVGSMSALLQPITSITGSLTNVVSGFTEDLNNVRNVISTIRNNMGGIFGLILGVFANVVLEFQKIGATEKRTSCIHEGLEFRRCFRKWKYCRVNHANQ